MTKQIVNTVAVALIAFALGWFMRGDVIYSTMFKNMVNVSLPPNK